LTSCLMRPKASAASMRIHSTLKPGGYLFLGASEALNGLPDHYQMVQCSPGIIYQAK
ncbi:MAG: CheR family methyltransferase, partial [Gammaproteobacteria bacterium]